MKISTFCIASITTLLSFCQAALAASRITPPAGALVVQAGTNVAGQFATITAALDALPNDGSAQSIFVYPGTYAEHIDITRTGALTIYGYTTDTTTYTSNAVVITAANTLTTAGSDDASGTLRIHTDDFSMYNINVKNTFGPGVQAIAFSNYGSRGGSYACGFYGYQDTLYSNEGTQVYLKSYIEGAVDFIFGRLGQAYFGGNTIAVAGPGCITASGREANNSAIYIFNKNTIVLASDAVAGTSGNVFLGRPWADFAQVIFTNTVVNVPLNKTIWSIWDPGDARTDDVFFAEYNTTGSGVTGAMRPSFSTLLTASQAAAYTIGTAVGSDYATWVDPAYLI